ncbi:MAG: pteridine reductase [Rhodanobacter sp.]
MSPRHDRPVALITGASRRVGASIARTLHAAGYDLALHYRHSDAEMHTLCAQLETLRAGSTLALQADLMQVPALRSLVEDTHAHYGRLDALVNNAAAFSAVALDATTPELWDEHMAVNVRAPFFLAQAAHAYLRASHGAIVNLTDIYADRPRSDLLAYAASKAALVSLTRGLASALAPEVRVNAVAPGAILWPDVVSSGELRASLMARTPLQRTGTLDEIANAVLWLVRDATYCTGEVLHVDGGRGIS